MTSDRKSPFSVLFYVWMAVSTFTNVVALASLADGIIAWSDFMQDMIQSYREIRDMVWGNLFVFIRVAVPSWVHDYLTVNSIFAVSLLWAMVHASESIQSGRLGSVLLYLRNNILDISVGGTIPKSFVKQAVNKLQTGNLTVSEAALAALDKLGRPIVSFYTVSKSVLMAALALVSYFGFAFLFPWIIQLNDRWNVKVAHVEFRRLRIKIKNMPFDAEQQNDVLTVFDRAIAEYAGFAAMDELFHETLQRSLWRYILAVVALFLLLIFVNQVAVKALLTA